MRSDHIDASSFNTQWKSGRFSHSRKVLTGNVQLTSNGSIVNAFDPGGLTYIVALPPLEAGRFYVVANTGASGTINVNTDLGATVATLTSGQSTLLFASDTTWTGVAGAFGIPVFGYTGPGHSTGLVPDPGIGPVDPNPSLRRFLGESGWQTVVGLAAGNAYFSNMKGGAVTLTPSGAEVLEFLAGNAAISILAQSGTTPKSIKFTINPGSIDHNTLQNYVADQHVAHSGVTLTAGLGISGGGDITASRTFDFAPSELTVNAAPVLSDYAIMDLAAGGPRRALWSKINSVLDHNALLNYVANQHIDHSGLSVVAGLGLSGGGTLTSSVALALDMGELTTATPNNNSFFAFWDSSTGNNDKASITSLNATLDHNALFNYVADQHIAHSTVTITGTEGVQGGGNIAASRTLKLDVNGLAVKTAPTTADFGVIYDVASGSHKKVALSNWVGITEAPLTGLYAREAAGWTAIPRIAVGTTPPASPSVNDVWIDTN